MLSPQRHSKRTHREGPSGALECQKPILIHINSGGSVWDYCKMKMLPKAQARPLKPPHDSKESIGMSKDATDLKYPMVDLITGLIMSLMYLNVVTAMNLSLLSAPSVFMEAWMKGLEGGSVVR